jgi:heme exporter protein A
MLKTANLSYKFDDKYIFSNLSFELANDSIFKLVGDNGSGKSTLLKILSGIYKNYEGDLSFSEDDLVFYSGHKTGLKNSLSARENIYFDIRLPKISDSQINSVLKQLDLIDYSDIQSAYLSEGQKRKINIASFMLSTANLYFLDEPFNNLDRKTTDLLQEIFDMKINEGAKIIFSSHDRSNDDFPLIDMNLFN